MLLCSKVLRTREEFVNTANLGAVDILAVRLWLDRKVHWTSFAMKPKNKHADIQTFLLISGQEHNGVHFLVFENRSLFLCPAMHALDLILRQDGRSLTSMNYTTSIKTNLALWLKLTS